MRNGVKSVMSVAGIMVMLFKNVMWTLVLNNYSSSTSMSSSFESEKFVFVSISDHLSNMSLTFITT